MLPERKLQIIDIVIVTEKNMQSVMHKSLEYFLNTR